MATVYQTRGRERKPFFADFFIHPKTPFNDSGGEASRALLPSSRPLSIVP